MAIEIRETPIGGKVQPFLDVVDYIYRDDPMFIRPLDLDMKQRLSKKNPFFLHAEGMLFTAFRNGWCVGRVSAQIDREHLALYKDDAGFFGFLDTIEDEEVAGRLLEAASAWLAARGMKYVRGPLSLSINEEFGCLVDGFDTPPMFMMPHHRPYQGGLVEKVGFTKKKDAFAWRYTVGDVPKRALKAHDEIEQLPEVKSRHFDLKTFDSDVHAAMDIFNDAWSDNWSFVPCTGPELDKIKSDLRMVAMPGLTYLTEIDGEPAAVAVALPNLNELIQDFHGKLMPIGLPKLLWRLKVVGPKTARLWILGIRKKYRGVRKYAGLSTYLYTKMNRAGRDLGIQWGELSWTLEDNAPVNVGIKFMGGKVYKTYRVYERAL
jgi:hypothetical protein